MMASVLLSLRRPPPTVNFRVFGPCSSRYLSTLSQCRTTSKSATQTRGSQFRLLQTIPSTSASSDASVPQPAEVVTEPISSPTSPKLTATTTTKGEYVYHGPLTTTFRRLKIFSLSSLTLSFTLTPLLFVIETTSALPLAARFALAGIALSTSGISTALVAWCGRPYVSTLRWLPSTEDADEDGTKKTQTIEMTTLTLGLHKRNTRVYDTAFLVPTSRPFATWELAEAFKLPAAEVETEKANGNLPREETVAETMDKKGGVVGRWIVQWNEQGEGKCCEQGRVARYFNVHEELLDRPLR